MADEPNTGGPPKPPSIVGTPPMTKTRQRLGSGGGAPRPAAPGPTSEQGEGTPGAGQTPTRITPPPAASQNGGDGDGAAPTPAARPTAPARLPAARPAPAPAAARPAAAAVAAPARPTAERLAAAVRQEPAAGGAAQAQGLVYVWPHLVTIEFVAALLMLLSMIVLSWVVNAPLEARANPDHTPNPSKAPWYFLNLQELLLHMHPALAGVIVPSGALTLIAMIPFFDRDTTDVGKWLGTARSVPIAIFVAIYTAVVEIGEIFFDAHFPAKVLMNELSNATGIAYFKEVEPFGSAVLSMSNTIIPLVFMLGPIVPLMFFIHKKWKPNTREVMVALFTGFVVSYVILTIFGTFFRGQGMQLFWPWDAHMQRID